MRSVDIWRWRRGFEAGGRHEIANSYRLKLRAMEEVVVDDHLLSALIGAAVASIGWIVTYFLQQRSKATAERQAFLRRQVEEFYSPLLALVKQKIYVQQVQDERMGKVPGGPDWVRALQFFEDNHTVPIMLEIAKLLTTKSYLAVEWPASFDEYLEHEAKSVALYQFWRNTGMAGDIETIPWPPKLEEDIRHAKAALESRLKQIYEAGASVR
jgi:hypothetical protein